MTGTFLWPGRKRSGQGGESVQTTQRLFQAGMGFVGRLQGAQKLTRMEGIKCEGKLPQKEAWKGARSQKLTLTLTLTLPRPPRPRELWLLFKRG